jgi:hypothetical protein
MYPRAARNDATILDRGLRFAGGLWLALTTDASAPWLRRRGHPWPRRIRSGSRSAVGLSEARAELAREQTQAVALRNAVARGEFVPLAIVRREIETIFIAFRERCLAVPGKVAMLCEGRSRAEVEEIICDEVHECLEELSDPTRMKLPDDPPAEAAEAGS